MDEYKTEGKDDWERRVGYVSGGKVSMAPKGNSMLTKGGDYNADKQRLR